ncbi:aldehyde dehydrogenase family protein [Haliea sp. E1-2-M8]|uniref:aldehyde dehydrogenase family protein n=1 Tax=Haliea sp. E1-2-M8 TaxID=3064706 RepID=UPI002726AB6E|nr:aldehyde dehydrogenase family protein [Haliea sp. E1-2-M8]MDO8863830.1 aldehyde dehydrogenase family protein [Haliea sp. E1-2-M8]
MSGFDPGKAQLFSENQYRELSGTEHDVINPATLESVGKRGVPHAQEIDRVLSCARRAQQEWSKLDPKTRAAKLHEVAHSMSHQLQREVSRLMTMEVGKPFPESMGELANIASIFDYYAELARGDAGSVAGSIQPGLFQFKRYDPCGVTAHIVPYNYPILIMAFTVAASLAAGNAVIIKPSEISTLCTLCFMQHFQSLPSGIVSCIPGDGSTGAFLVDSDQIDVVAFTGSAETAQLVAIACAKKMKPSVLEGGGNDPLIVSDHADIDFAAAAVTCSAFHLSGQICTSTERIYVIDSVHDDFVRSFVERVQALRVGDGFSHSEIGPMSTERSRANVIRLIQGAVEEGASVACGGGVPRERDVGWFFEPTVLSDVTPDMQIMQEELFGPVVAVCRVKDFDQALLLCNQSRYGLGASVLTTNLGEAMRAAEELQCGMVWINNPLVDNDALPFGGRKRSGLGRELGSEGLNAFRNVKYVTFDGEQRIQDWWYPYDDSTFDV